MLFPKEMRLHDCASWSESDSVKTEYLLFTWSGNKQHWYKYVFSQIDPERKGLCYFAERAVFKTTELCLRVSPLGT